MVDLQFGMLHSRNAYPDGRTTIQFDAFSSLSLPVDDTRAIEVRLRRAGLPDASNEDEALAIKVGGVSNLEEIKEKLSEASGIPADRIAAVYRVQKPGGDPPHLMDVAGNPVADHASLLAISPSAAMPAMATDGAVTVLYAFESAPAADEEDPREIAEEISAVEFAALKEGKVRVGMRLEGKEHGGRGHWFPGNVVDVSQKEGGRSFTVHFDNFADKWNLTYTLNDVGTSVAPLGANTRPITASYRFLATHQVWDFTNEKYVEFGIPAFVELQREWSAARAGAAVLSRVRSFLGPNFPGAVDVVEEEMLYGPPRTALESAVAMLLQADEDRNNHVRTGGDLSGYDDGLSVGLPGLLAGLPFDVMLVAANGKDLKEEPFPFDTARTIGNFLNARRVIQLWWKRRLNSAVVLYRGPGLTEHASYLASKIQEEGAGLSLRRCLEDYCRTKVIANSAGCEETRAFWRLPDLLSIELRRWTFSTRWKRKIDALVSFPIEGLDLSPFLHRESPCSNTLYDLYGVIEHHGSLNVGHYTACYNVTACGPDGAEDMATTISRPRWARFDDELVTLVETDKVVSKDAYILLYRRRSLTASNLCRYSSVGSEAPAVPDLAALLQEDRARVPSRPIVRRIPAGRGGRVLARRIGGRSAATSRVSGRTRVPRRVGRGSEP